MRNITTGTNGKIKHKKKKKKKSGVPEEEQTLSENHVTEGNEQIFVGPTLRNLTVTLQRVSHNCTWYIYMLLSNKFNKCLLRVYVQFFFMTIFSHNKSRCFVVCWFYHSHKKTQSLACSSVSRNFMPKVSCVHPHTCKAASILLGAMHFIFVSRATVTFCSTALPQKLPVLKESLSAVLILDSTEVCSRPCITMEIFLTITWLRTKRWLVLIGWTV